MISQKTTETTAVVGFGRAGQAMARYLHRCGAAVRVSDLRTHDELSSAEKDLLIECRADFEGGGHTASFFSGVDTMVVSPGVDSRHPALVQAQKNGSRIVGELAVAADRFTEPVVAVTGTNGKTTVTELIWAMFTAAGKKAFIGGNIGTPIGEYLTAEEEFDVVVLEVSSFQLDLCGDFAPKVGIVLNITPDHLDRHGTLEKYGAAKMKMFQGGGRTFGVINGEDELCCRFGKEIPEVKWARFGHADSFVGAIYGSRIVVQKDRMYDLTGSKLDNLSGRLNSSAALLGVSPFDLDHRCLQRVLLEFEPREHRLQEVGRVEGIAYVNDSKATNTGAVINALNEIGGPIILIAGGRDKGDDYRLLRDSIAAHVKRLILIGEAAGDIGNALGDLAPADYPATLEDAVAKAAAVGEPGDTVLLAPACASFDMFDSYQHRGRCFIDAVRRLSSRLSGASATEAAQ